MEVSKMQLLCFHGLSRCGSFSLCARWLSAWQAFSVVGQALKGAQVPHFCKNWLSFASGQCLEKQKQSRRDPASVSLVLSVL